MISMCLEFYVVRDNKTNIVKKFLYLAHKISKHSLGCKTLSEKAIITSLESCLLMALVGSEQVNS